MPRPLPFLPPVLFRFLVFPVALILAACSVSPVQPPATGKLPRVIGEHTATKGYARVVQTEADTFVMQTGSRLFRRPGRPDIDLVGACHIAERPYYRQLQKRLDEASLVLFEGVSDRKEEDPGFDRKDANAAYSRLARALGLVSQDAGIDYTRKTFRRCDLSMQEMMAILDEEIGRGGQTGRDAAAAKKELTQLGRMLGGGSWIMNFAIELVDLSPGLRERIRLMTVGAGLDEKADKQISARLHRLILQDRNAHVAKELRRLTGSSQRRIAVFYGADHLHELEGSLGKMGYRPAGGITWFDSISSHPYAVGISEKEVKEALGE